MRKYEILIVLFLLGATMAAAQDENVPPEIRALNVLGNCEQGALQITGSSSEIVIGVHSNDDLRITGSADVQGFREGSGSVVAGVEVSVPDVTFAPPETGASAQALRISFVAEDFGEHSAARQKAFDFDSVNDSLYHLFEADAGDVRLTGELEGLYYVENVNVSITQATVGPRGLTVVAPNGSIVVNALEAGTVLGPPFADEGVLLISDFNRVSGDCDSQQAVIIAASSLEVRGLIVAPFGGVHVNTSNSRFIGAIFGETINIVGSQNTFIYDPTLLAPQPPQVVDVEPPGVVVQPPVLATEPCAPLSGQFVRIAAPEGTPLFCRLIAANGAVITSPAEVGNQGLLGAGILHAVDIFSLTPDGRSVAVREQPITGCLLGSGALFLLDATDSARFPIAVSATERRIDGETFTCGTLLNAGTLVLTP